MSQNQDSRQLGVFAQALLVFFGALVFTGGCATQPPDMEVMRNRMTAHADEYRRVEIAPIWFAGSAMMDASLTADDLKALNRQVGTNLLTALKQALADKGYQVVQTGPVLCSDADLEGFDADTRRLLSEVRTNFVELSQEIYANRPNQKGKPYDCKVTSSLAELRKKLGVGDSDLVVLMDSKSFFESPAAHQKRSKWNRTGGAALMPLFVVLSAAALSGAGGGPGLPLAFSPSWMQHTVLIADTRTQDVLFWNARRFPTEDGRKPDALRAKLKDTLVDLAELRKSK